MIISVPPQHGKSYGASTLLPAFLLGLDPNLRICIASYSFALARKFGASVQKLIESAQYHQIFPKTKLKGMAGTPSRGTEQRTVEEFDVVGCRGGLRVVGREGSLTGNRVDVLILDDLYKDAMEANSPVVRQAVWEWYATVARTRLHNDSKELIVFTRWHTEDLIGRLLETEKEEWMAVNFEAIKTTPPTKIDPRKTGEALWPQRHSRELLLRRKKMDPGAFEALYQGNPEPIEGLLYAQFLEADTPEKTVRKAAYIDTADTGGDYLCAVAYSVCEQGLIHLTNVVYTQEPMEITEKLCAQMLLESGTQICHVESNNGGRGFARAMKRMASGCRIESFHQSANKISRILSNATEVQRIVRVPHNWQQKWPEFHHAITTTRREIAANKHDDAADTITGIVEKEAENKPRKSAKIKFSTKTKNIGW